MQAVVLVGGEGRRLRPLTDTRPKPMMNLVDRPFVEHQIDLLTRHGVDDIIFSCGYRPDALELHFGNGSDRGIRIRYVVDPEPLGTAGAIANAGDLFEGDDVLVLNGDILTDLNLTDVRQRHRESGGEATIVLTPVLDPSAFGLVRFDKERRVTEFLEKPGPDQLIPGEPFLINAGTYVLSAAAIARIPLGRSCSIEREIFPALADDRGLFAYPDDTYWRDIGTHVSYLDAHADVLAGRVATATAHNGEPFIGPDATIADGVRLTGGTCVGVGAHIASGAVVNDSVIGAGAMIGNGAKIDGSIIGHGAVVGSSATVTGLMVVGDDAAIAEGATLTGPGTVPTGARLDTDGNLTATTEKA